MKSTANISIRNNKRDLLFEAEGFSLSVCFFANWFKGILILVSEGLGLI